MACIGDALLGAVMGELVKLVKESIITASSCKQLLLKLESTLNSITPRIQEIQKVESKRADLNRTGLDELVGELVKAKVFVRKSSKIQCWDVINKYRCSKKIMKFNVYLVNFFQVDVPLGTMLDTKQILVEVHESNRKLDQISSSISLGCSSGSPGTARSNASPGSISSGFGSFRVVPEVPSGIVGLNVPLKELKMELFKDGVTVVGLCAPGGCGKTTLAAMLCQDAEVKEKFKENIFFLTVSSSPNLKEILQRLFDQMDYGYRVPENDDDAVNHLGYLLKKREQEPMLLVLDDVWTEEFLGKLVFRHVRYKLLVTSRSMLQTFDSTYSLKMLSESDAIALFSHIAIPQDADYERPDEDLLNKIVRGCKGFPLALKVIAHSLRRQPARKWRSTERMLSKGSSIFDAHTDLLNCLSTSLGFLKGDVKECFLDLGCFPEDQRIPAAALIDIWVELYELDEDDAFVNLHDLSTRNLVNLLESTRKDAGEIDGDFNELFVVQHDLLRDLAIHQSRGDQNLSQSKRLMMDRREDNLPKSWRDQVDQAFNARFVSINTGEMVSSEWCKLQFPVAEILMMNISTKNFTLPQFMDTMGKLKVLIIANHGPHHASLSGLPALGGGCLSHLKRIRLERVSVPSLNEITEPLKNLQKISFVMCKVSRAFKNCNINISSMLPNLTEIDVDYCNDMIELPQEICMSSSLEKLSITNCHNLATISESIGEMRNLEVLRLHACTELLELPNSIRTLDKLRFLDISDCSNLERMPEGMGELCGLRKLDMRHCSRVRRLPRSTRNLKHLKDVICDEEMSIHWETYQVYLPKLNIKLPKDNINLDWLGFDFTNQSFYS